MTVINSPRTIYEDAEKAIAVASEDGKRAISQAVSEWLEAGVGTHTRSVSEDFFAYRGSAPMIKYLYDFLHIKRRHVPLGISLAAYDALSKSSVSLNRLSRRSFNKSLRLANG